MNSADLDFLSSIPPEELQKLLGLGTLDERGDQLTQQLMQAQALQNAQPGNHSTGMGAALGGLGDAINAGVGGYRQGQIQEEQQALLGQKDAGRNSYANLMIEALRKRNAPPAATPVANGAPTPEAIAAMFGGF